MGQGGRRGTGSPSSCASRLPELERGAARVCQAAQLERVGRAVPAEIENAAVGDVGSGGPEETSAAEGRAGRATLVPPSWKR